MEEPIRVIVFFVAGWGGKVSEKRLRPLKESMEGLPVSVVAPNYLNIRGPLVKVRTRKSIRYYARIVEAHLQETKAKNPDVPIIIIGHSMGALIARLLLWWGHDIGWWSA